MDTARLQLTSNSPEATRSLGEFLASRLTGAATIALEGDLGAGKTTFVQGLGRGLGVAKPVTSPTFVLINRYRCADGRYLQHADCYRLQDAPLEMWDVGLSDLMLGEDVVVVEWADRVPGLLPEAYLRIAFSYVDEAKRRLIFTAYGTELSRLLDELRGFSSALPGVSVEDDGN